MWKVLNWAQKNLVWSIPIAMVAGLLFGQMADPAFLRWGILPLTFLMVYPMMVTMNVRDLLKPGGNRLQGTTLAVNFLLMPAIGYGMGLLFFADQPMVRLALLLTALLPTSGMTISWTGFAKGNVPAAVKMTVVGLIAGSLLAPVYLKALLGAVVEIPVLQVFGQIALIVFLPLVLGTLTQRWLTRKHGEAHFNQKLKPKFPPISTLGVLGIVFVSMALKSRDIFSNPALLPNLLLPLVLIYALNFAISTLIGALTEPLIPALLKTLLDSGFYIAARGLIALSMPLQDSDITVTKDAVFINVAGRDYGPGVHLAVDLDVAECTMS